MTLAADDPLAVAAAEAIRGGDLAALRRLLSEHPGLAAERIGDEQESRTLLHVVTDWPGHFPGGAETVAVLVEAGADPNAPFGGEHPETPLHWAASSDDIDVLDALIDAGANVDAPGAVIAGGPPLADATAFGQWQAAHRLVERGARTTLWDEATLGLLDRLEGRFAADPPPAGDDVNQAFWGACHGGQRGTAEYLLERGADPNWVPPWEELTPLDVAQRSEAAELVEWLRGHGGKLHAELE